MRGRIKLGDHVSDALIEVNGQRIENGVRRLSIDADAGGIPRINVELGMVERIDIEGTVSVAMTGSVRDALIALGWTPPAEG